MKVAQLLAPPEALCRQYRQDCSLRPSDCPNALHERVAKTSGDIRLDVSRPW
jgi:hypothetical protein